MSWLVGEYGEIHGARIAATRKSRTIEVPSAEAGRS